MKYDDKAANSTVDAFTGRTNKRGGKREGAGRKGKWYGKTIAMRVPESWAERIQFCMDNEITPTFEPSQENVQNQLTYEQGLEVTREFLKNAAVYKWRTEKISASAALRWAKEQGLEISDMTIAKKAKAKLEQWEKKLSGTA